MSGTGTPALVGNRMGTHATEGDWMGVERGQRSYTRINNCNNIK
jgi:hypothetical protein